MQKDGSLKRYLDYVEKIEIEDAFGFFNNLSLVGAIGSMPKGLIVSDEELATIVSGKKDRGYLEREALTPEKFDELKRYTGLELKALVRLVEETERALIEADAESRAADLRALGADQAAIDADLEKRYKLLHLHGAGAAAQALLKVRLPADPRPLLGNVAERLKDLDALVSAMQTAEPELKRDEALKRIALDSSAPPEPRALVWSTYAYFGGRIEAPMQGKTRGRLFSNDISSAYPAQIAKLPSMAGGRWRQVFRPTREQVFSSSMLSEFLAKTRGFPLTLSFYPAPWRTKAGAVVYPPDAYGIWMRDEVIGMFEFRDRFRQGEIEVIEGLIFEPADPSSRPFAWVSSMFDYRAGLLRADKKDVRATSIKLALNSLYGKLAQGVGGSEEPPLFASPWMAAAVTAGVRLQVLRAALTKPDKVVSFATDEIFWKSPPDIPTSAPGEKELGVWGATKTIKHGGVFVMSGVAHMVTDKNDTEDGAETKTRGFNPANYGDRDADPKARIAKIMLEEIPAAWEADKPEFKFPYQQYMGLGGSVQARFTESCDRDMEAFIAHRQPQRRRLQTVCASGRRIRFASPVESEKTDPPRREKFRERHAPRRIERARSAGLDERSIKKRVRYDRGRQECPGGLQRELRDRVYTEGKRRTPGIQARMEGRRRKRRSIPQITNRERKREDGFFRT